MLQPCHGNAGQGTVPHPRSHAHKNLLCSGVCGRSSEETDRIFRKAVVNKLLPYIHQNLRKSTLLHISCKDVFPQIHISISADANLAFHRSASHHKQDAHVYLLDGLYRSIPFHSLCLCDFFATWLLIGCHLSFTIYALGSSGIIVSVSPDTISI